MFGEIWKPASWFALGTFVVSFGSETARTIMEPNDKRSVDLYFAGAAHSPDLPHAPDNEPSAPAPQMRILAIATSTASAGRIPGIWSPSST